MNKKELKVLKSPKYIVYSDKPKNELEGWIQSLAPKLLNLYGLGKMAVNMSGEVRSSKEGRNGAMMVFSVMYDKTYKCINLTVYELAQDAWVAGDKEFLLSSLIHEFAHVLTTELAELAFARHVTKKEILSSVEELTESIAILARELYELKSKN
jgi:hypothetical protein